jgi:3-methyladenine DNA glycosylase/8-oxoguanine DNA glycosylase
MEVPGDYLLKRDVCSYGYFLLEPNHWDVSAERFSTTMGLGDVVATVTITQGEKSVSGKRKAKRGDALKLVLDRRLNKTQRIALEAGVHRMLNLGEETKTIRAFHALDPRFKKEGRGRLMRSPTLFEDVIKTVTSCNVTWPNTITMNRKLCESYGRESASGKFAFPTAEVVAKLRPASLRARCSVGYRDARIVELAKMFVRGEIRQEWFEDLRTPDEEVFEALLELPGIGPYAAANIMQLLNRYSRLPLDTESVRHGKSVLGFKGTSKQIMKKVHQHFEPFGEHKFRSYWFELWAFYEKKRGAAWTWEKETTGKTFTASKLAEEDWEMVIGRE